jgi:hypothetical protein
MFFALISNSPNLHPTFKDLVGDRRCLHHTMLVKDQMGHNPFECGKNFTVVPMVKNSNPPGPKALAHETVPAGI